MSKQELVEHVPGIWAVQLKVKPCPAILWSLLNQR